MKLQELVNKLSNMLASGAGEANMKIDNKDINTVTLVENEGIKTVIISPVK